MGKMSEQDVYQDLAREKKRLRQEILSIRNAMSGQQRAEKSEKILQTLYSTDWYRMADIILAYADYQSEVMTLPLIEKAFIDGKKVFCPKALSGNDMEFYRIYTVKELKPGYKGIREPAPEALEEEFSDYIKTHEIIKENNGVLVIVPGAAFDKTCYRIGYGKGFYDKYLTRMSEKGVELHTIGLGYECQMLPEVPSQAHDIGLDMVVTEMRVYANR